MSLLRKPSFSRLWSSYPSHNHNCSMALPNQCAIRVSIALIGAGWPANAFSDPRYTGHRCPHGLARGAQDLGAFLNRVWGGRDQGWDRPGSKPGNISGKGVICFMNIPGFSGQGHIDLFDGSATKTGAYWNSSPIWFWRVT